MSPVPRRTRDEMNINIDLDMTGEKRIISTAPPPKPKQIWTEVTKDLVSREAIDKVGYEYEETDEFFYVMDFLKYVSGFCLALGISKSIDRRLGTNSISTQEDVAELVAVTEDLHRVRRERIEEIQWERQDPRLAKSMSPPDGRREREVVYEMEVVYEDRERPRRYR